MAILCHHKNVEGWRNKSFPLYERLAYTFGKDRAIGKGVETPVDMIENENENNLDTEFEVGEGLSPMSMDQSQTKSSKRKRATSTNLLI